MKKPDFNKDTQFLASDYIFDVNVTLSAKLTYIYLSRSADNKGIASVSYSQIASACGFARCTAVRAIEDLIEAKLIDKKTQQSEDRKLYSSNLYVINALADLYKQEV